MARGTEIWQWRLVCRLTGKVHLIEQKAGAPGPSVCPDDPAHLVQSVQLFNRRHARVDFTSTHPIPGPINGITEGWDVGSRILAVDGIVYECLANPDSAALWESRGQGGGSGSGHRTLRHLIHFIDSGPAGGFATGAFHEMLPSADPFPLSYIWWVSSGKAKKIVGLILTRNSNKTPATETWRMYDIDGTTVLVTVTDTISYSGVFETSRTRTIV
jgi:hypothetical protein